MWQALDTHTYTHKLIIHIRYKITLGCLIWLIFTMFWNPGRELRQFYYSGSIDSTNKGGVLKIIAYLEKRMSICLLLALVSINQHSVPLPKLFPGSAEMTSFFVQYVVRSILVGSLYMWARLCIQSMYTHVLV